MSRRQDKCQQRQGLQAPDGTDALTVGVNVTLTGPGSTESRPGGGMEVKVKVLQGRTPESEAMTRGIAATATSSHHTRPVTAPAAISDDKKLEVEQLNNDTEGVEFTFTRGSSHFQDADHVPNDSDDVMEIEVLPFSRNNPDGLPIYHRTVATVSSGKHRDVVYIDGKIEARSSHEQTIIKEDVSSCTGIRELSLKQESKHEKTSLAIGNVDVPTEIKATSSESRCEDSDKDYTVTETENIEILTDSIELKICGTMTTSTRDSSKGIPESCSTDEFEKPPLMKKTGSCLIADESEKCPNEDCLPICPKRSRDIAKSEALEDERRDITMTAELSFKLSCPITPDDAQKEPVKSTESGTLTGELKVMQDDTGDMKSADLELLIQETRYVSPTDSFTDVVHETHAIVSQSAPMIEKRGKDLQKDDVKSENLNKKYEDMFRSMSLESFSEEVYELTVVTEEITDGERQTCTCSGDQDNRDEKGIQSDSVQKVTSETMTSDINLLDFDDTARRFRELLSESVDQGMATEIVQSISMATSISEDHLQKEDIVAKTSSKDNSDKIRSDQNVDSNNNITSSPGSESSSCVCDLKDVKDATDDSSSKEDIDTEAVECECKIEGEMTQNKGMQSDAIEESQVGTMTSDIEFDSSDDRGIEDDETSKIITSDGEIEQQECVCSLEAHKSTTSRGSRKSALDVTETPIQTDEIITKSYSTMTDDVTMDLTSRCSVERGCKPEITEDDILDDDGVTFDTRRYSRPTADQSRDARSPLRDQLITPESGPRNGGTNESLISFMRDLWSELESTNPPPLSTEPRDNIVFRTFRHQVEPEETTIRPVTNRATKSSTEIAVGKIVTQEDGTDVSELGDVDDSLFAVSSNDTELTAEISVTMTVVDEAGDNLQEQLNADDDMTDMLFMQMLDNDNILEGEAVDIVQRIVNLPGFDELLMDSSTMTDQNMEDKSQMVDMCVQSDTILSVHSGASIGKVSARSVPLVVDKKDVANRRNPTGNQQQDAGDEMEKDSGQEKQEKGEEKPVDGSKDTKIPSKCLLNECRETCAGYANEGSDVPTLEYESKPYSDILSDTALSGDEDSTMPELQDVGEGDKSAEDGKPAPTETKDLNATTSGKIGTISLIDTVAIDTGGITVTSSATVVNSGTQSVTDTVTVRTDNVTIKSSLTVTTAYSSDTIPTKKSVTTRESKETPDEVDSVAVKSEDEPKESRSATDAMPDEAGDVSIGGVCNDDICTKKSVPKANEEPDTAQVHTDKICTKCSVTSGEMPCLTETSPDDSGDIRGISSPTLMGTTENMEVQTDDISTKSAAMTTDEISNEIEVTLDQNEDLTSKEQDDITSDGTGKEAEITEITQEETDDLTAKSSPSRIETPCPCVADTLSVQTDEIITENKSVVANITDTVTVQTDAISTKSSATMTANDLPNVSDMMPEDTNLITSKSSTTMKIKEGSPDLSDLKAEGYLEDTEQIKDRTSSISMQTDHVSAKDSSTMTDKKSKDGQGISFTETDSILITENITDIKITTDINLTENDGTVAGFEKEGKLEISATEQKLDILSTTIVKSNPVFPIMDENCHKCCAVKSDMAVQDCIKCCAQFGADKNILDKKSPESMVEMGRKSGVVIVEQDQLDSEDVTDVSVQSDEIPTSEATTGEHISIQEMSDLLSNVSMQCDPIHTTHIGTSMSASSKSNHTMLSKLNVQSDPMLKKHPSFDERIDKKSTTQSYHAVSEVSASMTVRSSSHLGVSEEGEGTISKQSITDTDSDIFDNSKIPPDSSAPIMSIVQINAPDHLIHLISVSVQNEPISTRNSSTMTELKLTEVTDSHADVESKDSKLEPAELTPEIEKQRNVEEVGEVGADLDKQDVDITKEDKSDVKDETKWAAVSDKNMQTKNSKAISTMTDTMPTHFSDRVVQYGATVRTQVVSSTHSDGGGTRERHETSRNIAEEIQILLHEKTIKTVDMESPDFVTRDYMTESTSKLADGPEVTASAEKMEDEVPELVETLGPARVEIAEAEGDFRPRDDENMDSDGIDFLMPEGDFLMPADGVPVTPPTTSPAAPPVLSEPTVAAISEKQDGRFTMSDGPMELLYDVRLPDSHLDHPESPPRSREAEPAPPETPSPEQETPSATESAPQEPTVGKELLMPDNLQITGTGLNADSTPPQTECYSSMTEGDYMLHKIKKLPAPTPSQTSQTDRDDLVSSAECIDCEPCHPEIRRRKKYRAPAPPPLTTEKPVEEVREEELVLSSAGEQEREEAGKPLQRKGSFRKSLFKKLKFEKTVKQKSSAKGSDELAAQKQRGSTKPTTKPPPESNQVKIKTDPSIHRKKCVPLSEFTEKTFSKPDSRKADQIQSKPKINPKPPLRLSSTDRTFRSRGKPTRTDDLPALEDRTDVRPSCAAKVQDEILQQLGHKLQMIGQPRKREDASPRRAIMIGRDLPSIIGSVPIDPERDCMELRELTSRLQSDGTDDGALFISLDNPPPGTEVVVQTAESPGKAHSLKIRSTQPGEDTRSATIGLIKAQATHVPPRRVISPIRFQPRTHYLMRPSSPTNIPPELRITPLHPYDHCAARDGISSQTLTNLVLESPPVGTAYVVFPVPTDGTQSDEGAQRVLSDHIHRQADAVSVAIVDNNIVPYPHSNACMCQEHCQNRVCLNQPQRVYAPAPDWIGTRQCTRNLCSRQGTRRWCSVHHTFHRD